MVRSNKNLHSEHTKELIDLSNQLDNLNLIGNVYDDDFLNDTLESEELRTQRDDTSNKLTNYFQNKFSSFYCQVTNEMFGKLEHRSNLHSRGRISSNVIAKSSQKSIVTISSKKSTKINNTMWNIADHNIQKLTFTTVFVDQHNEHCFSVPLEDVVCEHSDRKILVYAGNRKLKTNEKRNGKVHAYEFGWAYNLNHESNKQIKKSISTYLNNAFEDERNQIEEIIDISSTQVLMIINRESTLSDKITATNIVSLVMFGNEDYAATCIDYLATAKDYTGMHFAPFLMHNAQIFGCKAISRLTENVVQNNFTTVLLCKDVLSTYYKRLGFSSNNLEIYLNDDKFKGATNRMHLQDFVDREQPTEMYKVMRLDNICGRFVNYLSYYPTSFENALYDETNDDEVSQWSNVSLLTKLNSCFEHELQILIEERKYFELTYKYEDMFTASKNGEKNFFEKLYRSALKIPIGKIYRAAVTHTSAQITSDRMSENISSALILEVLDPLTVLFYFKDITNDGYDNSECWINVRCSCCKKNVHVKKQSTEYFNVFMTKVIASIWFVHIFGLENVADNDWYTRNQTWNICTSRKGSMYNKLKNALHLDSLKEDLTNEKTNVSKSLQNLDGLWEKIYQTFPTYFIQVTKMSFLINRSMQRKLRKRETTRDFATRSKELLDEIAPSKKTTTKEQEQELRRKQYLSNKQKRKREREVTKERHSAEVEWRDIYFKDLELQKHFRDIEYVDISSCDALDPASVTYLDDLKEDQQNSRKKKKQRQDTDTEVDVSQNHFLMYDSKSSTAHVVDEDWFTKIDSVNNSTIYIVTKNTIDKCMSSPNQKFALSTADKRNIKNHVQDIRIGSQIIKIKRVKEKAKDQEEEVVDFEGHVSSSKMAYIGYDVRNRYHKISEDWVQMNFKTNHPETFKKIVNLKPGHTHTIEPGSSIGSNKHIVETMVKKFDISLIGPIVKFVQFDTPSCLPSSIASALSYLGEENIANRIMKYYREFVANPKNEAFDMNQILKVTKYNYGRGHGEKRWRCFVDKIKKPNATHLLNDTNNNCFYHCVLMNNHAIVLIDKWIIDPTLQNALPRDKKHLTFSAQMDTWEEFDKIVFNAYRYFWNAK